jgi:transaldolase
LIFSVERYHEVMDAYFEGLRQAKNNGKDLSKIHSVASFFVSRVDTEVDKRLVALGKPELKSKAALANARLAYAAFLERTSSAEWTELAASGARYQRPLMASTGVKDPALPDTLYVTELIAKNLDLIVLNDAKQEGAGFGTDTNIVTLIDKGREQLLPKLSKDEVAIAILNKAMEILKSSKLTVNA